MKRILLVLVIIALISTVSIVYYVSTPRVYAESIANLPWFSGYETGDYSEWDATRVAGAYRTLDDGRVIFVKNKLKIIEFPVHHGSYASYHKSYGDFMNWQGGTFENGTVNPILFLGNAWPAKDFQPTSHVYVAWYQYFLNVPNYDEYQSRYPEKSKGALNVRIMRMDANVGEIVRVYLKVPEWGDHPMLAHIYYWDGSLKQTARQFVFKERIWYFFLYEFDANASVHRLYIQEPPYSNITSSTLPVIEIIGADTAGVTVGRVLVGQFEADYYDQASFTDDVTVSDELIQPELNWQPPQPMKSLLDVIVISGGVSLSTRAKVTINGEGTQATYDISDFPISLNAGTYSLTTVVNETGETYGPDSLTIEPNEVKVWTADFSPVDNTPPHIGTPIRDPPSEDLPLGQEVTVSVNVTDDEGGVREVILSYSLDNGTTWMNITMENVVYDLYEATIPGQQAETWVKYKIIAYDKAGNQATKDGIEPNYTFHVIPEFPIWTSIVVMLIVLTVAVALYKCRTTLTRAYKERCE